MIEAIEDIGSLSCLPYIVSDYRRRQERARQMRPFRWIGSLLILFSSGLLIYWILLPRGPLPAPENTQTPTLTPTTALSTHTSTAPVPTPTGPPAPTGTAVPSETPGARSLINYTVQSGDTLVSIAERYGCAVEAIIQENSLENPDQIGLGLVLRIPVGEGVALPEMTATSES